MTGNYCIAKTLLFVFFFSCTLILFAQSQGSEIKESGIQLNITAGTFSTSLHVSECGYGISDWKDVLSENFCAPLAWVGVPDSLGCVANNTPLNGKVVLIREGGCPIATKAAQAQAAGAKSVLIVENPGAALSSVSRHILGTGAAPPPVQIPVFYLKQSDFQSIQVALQTGAPMTACFKRPAVFLNSVFYPSEIQQYCYSTVDTFAFAVHLSNLSGTTLENVVVRGALLFNGVEIQSSVRHIPQIDASVTDSLYWLPDIFQSIVTQPGIHQVTYMVQGTLSGIPYLDVRNVQFDAYRPVYAKELSGTQVFYRPDSIPDIGWGMGNLFYITGNGLDAFRAREATLSVIPGEENVNAASYDIQVMLFSVNEEVLPDFSNFSTVEFLSESLVLEGIGLQTVNPALGQTSFSIEILNLVTAEPDLYLYPGKRYLLGAFFEDEARHCFAGFDETYRVPGVSTIFFAGGWKEMYGAPNAVLRLSLGVIDGSCTIGTDEPHQIDFKIYPNPCRDQLNLQVALTESSEAFIQITDMTGRTFLSDRRNIFSTEQLTFPISHLPNGAYSVRITTKEGSLTKKFIVQKE